MRNVIIAFMLLTAVAGCSWYALARETATPTIVLTGFVEGEERTLVGVVDLRELVLARDDAPMGEVMISPVITAEDEDLRDDLQELFAKYHYRMLPVVDAHDRLLGVVRYNEIMRGLVTKVKA